MEKMPSLNVPVQRLKVAILPLDFLCSGPVTHSGEILTTGKSHRKKSDRMIQKNQIWHRNLFSSLELLSGINKKYYFNKENINKKSYIAKKR